MDCDFTGPNRCDIGNTAAISKAFGTEANQGTSSESSLHNRVEGHHVIRDTVAQRWTPTVVDDVIATVGTWPHFVSAWSFAASCSSARAPERMPDIP